MGRIEIKLEILSGKPEHSRFTFYTPIHITPLLQMKAAALELKEADATVALQSRNITALRDRIAHVRSLMYQLMTRQNEMEQDILVQLNMQQGQVCKTKGFLSDANHSVLSQ